MKKTSFAALLALACAPLAQATADAIATGSTNPPAPTSKTTTTKTVVRTTGKTAAETALVEQFVALQDKAIATFLELGETLRGVKNQQSADAAAPTVKQAGENLFNIISKVEALGEPSKAAQQAIMARVANEAEKTRIVEQVMVPLLTLMMQNPPCYGSDSLNSELNNLLTNLQGAAGLDEDEADEDIPAPLQEPDGDESPHVPGA